MNQTVLPNLYEYLHAALAVVSWLLGALGLLLLAFGLGSFPVLWAAPRRFLVGSAFVALLRRASLQRADAESQPQRARGHVRSRARPAAARCWRRPTRCCASWKRTRASRACTSSDGAPRRADTVGPAQRSRARTCCSSPSTRCAPTTWAPTATRARCRPGSTRSRGKGVHVRARLRAGAALQLLAQLAAHLGVSARAGGAGAPPAQPPRWPRVLREQRLSHGRLLHRRHLPHRGPQAGSAIATSAFGFALFDHTNRESEEQTDRVLAEVDRISEQGEPPSLLWVHYFDVHEPYQETTFGSGDMDRYDSEIMHVDRELTRLIAELDRRFDARGGDRHLGRSRRGVPRARRRLPRLDAVRRAGARAAAAARHGHGAPTLVEAPVEVIDIAPTLLGMVGVGAAAHACAGATCARWRQAASTTLRPVFSAVLTKRMARALAAQADRRPALRAVRALRPRAATRTSAKPGAASEPERAGAAARRRLRVARLARAAARCAGGGRQAARATRAALGPTRRPARSGADGRSCCSTWPPPTEQRIEAGQILAKLADESSRRRAGAGAGHAARRGGRRGRHRARPHVRRARAQRARATDARRGSLPARARRRLAGSAARPRRPCRR